MYGRRSWTSSHYRWTLTSSEPLIQRDNSLDSRPSRSDSSDHTQLSAACTTSCRWDTGRGRTCTANTYHHLLASTTEGTKQQSVASLGLVSPWAVTDGVTLFFSSKSWRPFFFLVIATFLAVVSSPLAYFHDVYQVFFLNSVTKIHFIRVLTPEMVSPRAIPPPTSDASDSSGGVCPYLCGVCAIPHTIPSAPLLSIQACSGAETRVNAVWRGTSPTWFTRKRCFGNWHTNMCGFTNGQKSKTYVTVVSLSALETQTPC